MKYSTEIIVNLPRDQMIELFNSEENLYKWMPGLQSVEHIDGERGETGARSRQIFDMNGRTIEMIETIEESNFPEVFQARYETKGVLNISRHRFEPAGPEQTRWINENDFEFSGVMRLIGVVMRRSFPKQSLEFQEHFKKFAEGSKAKSGA